jgi:hypothetical protein
LLTGDEGGEGGGRGAESNDREKVWPSINHSILSAVIEGKDEEFTVSAACPPGNTNQSTNKHQLPRWILYLYNQLTNTDAHCAGGPRLLEEAEGHAEGSSL